MVQRSKGFRSKTRHKLTKAHRERGLAPLTRYMADFAEGTRVAVVLDPSSQRGMPHPRFHGLTGIVVGRRGEAFEVELKAGNKTKTVVARPEHLREQV